MKDNQEKVIKLINKIDELFDYFDIDDIIMSDDYDNNLKLFSNYLDMLFKDGLNNEILDIISKIDKKEIFFIEQVEEYRNNKIRKEIVEYLKKLPLYFDYDLIKENIKNNYKLANYVKDKELLLELVDINEKVILLLEYKYLNTDFILKYMNKSNFITEIFLGMHGTDNDLYRYSIYYKDNEEINDLLYKQAKKYLEEDIYKYIKASYLVKNNDKINKLVVDIDERFILYNKDLNYIGCVLPVITENNVMLDEAYIDKNHNLKYKVEPFYCLYEAFVPIIEYNFYYSYDINNKHTHSHSFEEVLKNLYYFPKTFNINKDEECYFSDQELKFINKLKKLLNVINLEDIKNYDKDYLISRTRNKKLKELFEYRPLHLEFANDIKDRKINKFFKKYFDMDDEFGKYIIIDKDDNYLCLIKTKREKILFKNLDDFMIDYNSYGFKSLLDYKNDIKDKYIINDDDYILIEEIIDIKEI